MPTSLIFPNAYCIKTRKKRIKISKKSAGMSLTAFLIKCTICRNMHFKDMFLWEHAFLKFIYIYIFFISVKKVLLRYIFSEGKDIKSNWSCPTKLKLVSAGKLEIAVIIVNCTPIGIGHVNKNIELTWSWNLEMLKVQRGSSYARIERTLLPVPDQLIPEAESWSML